MPTPTGGNEPGGHGGVNGKRGDDRAQRHEDTGTTRER